MAFVWANDSIGNINDSEIVSFSIDSLIPTINLTFPLPQNYITSITSLDYKATDANLQACWYSLTNGTSNTSVTCGTNLTGLNSGSGNHTWIIFANDSAGNEVSSSVLFFVISKTCGIGQRGILIAIKIVASLAVLFFSVSLFFEDGKLRELKSFQIIGIFVGTIIGLVMVNAIANSIFDYCHV